VWAYNNSNLFNGNIDRICVCGDSAGGNLAASVTLMSRQKNGPPLSLQVLVYPAVDLSRHDSRSLDMYGHLPTLTSESILTCTKTYLSEGNNPREPYISPIYSPDLTDLPQALFIIAECDVLADDGLNYAKKLESSHIHVNCRIFKGMPHGFFDYPYKDTFDAMDYICDALNKL
jgi:acetyl esterase